MWKLPWVSRERLEEAERRLVSSDAERQRVIDILLFGAVPDHTKQIQAVESTEDVKSIGPAEEIDNESCQPVSFTTPFDRVLTRFDGAFSRRPKPAQFKARV
jgi:hypothetical protein